MNVTVQDNYNLAQFCGSCSIACIPVNFDSTFTPTYCSPNSTNFQGAGNQTQTSYQTDKFAPNDWNVHNLQIQTTITNAEGQKHNYTGGNIGLKEWRVVLSRTRADAWIRPLKKRTPRTAAQQFRAQCGNERKRVYHAMSISPLSANTAPQWRDLRSRREERIWRKLRAPDLPVRKGPDMWRVGSPKEEARAIQDARARQRLGRQFAKAYQRHDGRGGRVARLGGLVRRRVSLWGSKR